MIYRCGLFNRRAGLSDAEFRDHWRNVHGVLAARLPGLGSYRQNHILQRLYEMPDSPVQAIDGVSQLSFESAADMERSDVSAEYAACKLDIPKFQGGITILVIESDTLMARTAAANVAKLLWVSGGLGAMVRRRRDRPRRGGIALRPAPAA